MADQYHSISPKLKTSVISAVCMTVLLSGCSGKNKDDLLYRPGTIHVEAQQELLEGDLSVTKEDLRTLRDRFNALERLYVDLIRTSQDQQVQLSEIAGQLKNAGVEKTSVERVRELGARYTAVSEKLERLEGRLFSVELEGAPMKRDSEAMAAPGEEGIEASDGMMKDKVSSSDAVMKDEMSSADSMMAPEMAQKGYGVHLGSYRSRDQIPGSWTAFQRVFLDELGGLQARVFIQTQDGIGEFMRLIAGPVASEEEAESICTSIKSRAREQFCVAAAFEGTPIEG